MKLTIKLCALLAALILAPSAQAISFPLYVTVTFAAVGNPFGAVVGTTANAGIADIGSQTVAGLPEEEKPLNPAFDAAASLSLTIGNILFGDEDDIDVAVTNDIPALIFMNGIGTGLDFVVLLELSGTSAIGEDFVGTDLGQDTSHFLNTAHYWADFQEDGAFEIGLITGFTPLFDDEEMETFLEPDTTLLVAGNITVPEPSLALLGMASLAALGLTRRP